MDFVKFYIVQLIKSAAARIRLTDKEKEKLLSRLVSKIENSRDLFPDLKTMERVVELEEAANKLISIYRRLNKSHIDLEKISYQFVSDRDSLQSILRRFLQGNYRTGIVSKKRPKIVFDDTTFTIYELKEPETVETDEQIHDQPKQPRIELNEFLKDEKEEIVAIKKEEIEGELQINEISNSDVYKDLKEEKSTIPEKVITEESLEIDNGVAQRSIEKTSRVQKDETEDLVLPLQFEEEQINVEQQKIHESEVKENIKEGTKESTIEEAELKEDKIETIEEKVVEENFQSKVYEEETEIADQNVSDVNLYENEQEFEGQKIEKAKEEKISEESSIEVENISSVLQTTSNDLSGVLFLDFEKLILDNILRVDEFLNRALKNEFSEEENSKIIDEAHRCLQLAQELQHDVISELIKVYWLSLTAIKDGKLIIDKTNVDLIRSTMIVLVSLIKGREIDLEPFLKKHNSLKEKLQQLHYEV